MKEQKVAIIGMSHSGKTTWLGRLWYAVRRQDSKLRLDRLPERLHGLRVFAEPLLKNLYPQRSNTGKPGALELPLRWQGESGDRNFVLEMSDYDGEEIDRILTRRDIAWSDLWESRALQSDGIIVMVRKAKVEQVVSDRLPNAPSPRSLDPDSPESAYPSLQDPRTAQADKGHTPIPTAIALVELLQFIRHVRDLPPGFRPGPDMLRVAVVVSCWDAMNPSDSELGPERWFHSALPLLSDYLEVNFHPRAVRFFGLSSTGGNLLDKDYIKSLEDEDKDIYELGYVTWTSKGVPVKSPDVTLPLGWVLEGDAALER